LCGIHSLYQNPNGNTFADLFTKAKVTEGPMMVAIRCGESGHAVLVGKTINGVKIIDQCGVFSNFSQLTQQKVEVSLIGVLETYPCGTLILPVAN
jgi:hypothetical protein